MGHVFHGSDHFVRELLLHYCAFSKQLPARLIGALCRFSDANPAASFEEVLQAVTGAVPRGGEVQLAAAGGGKAQACASPGVAPPAWLPPTVSTTVGSLSLAPAPLPPQARAPLAATTTRTTTSRQVRDAAGQGGQAAACLMGRWRPGSRRRRRRAQVGGALRSALAAQLVP